VTDRAAAAVVEALRAQARGNLIAPSDPAYAKARHVWNGMIDKRPLVIVQCAGVADVIATVNYARNQRLPLAVRGGGHSVPGNGTCDGGIVLDFALMKGVRVDTKTRTVRAEPGVRWRELDHETQQFGLAVTGGTDGDTGIAGLTLGGGFGFLAGKLGFTVDNLLSVDIVLASGELVHASGADNPDLFWAVRGGSGNFGVVTSFEYQLHAIGPLLTGGLVLHPLERGVEMLRFFRDFSRKLPDEMTTAAALLTAPDGRKAAAMVVCHCGPLEDGTRAVQAVKNHGSPVLDTIGPISYSAQQALFKDAFPSGLRHYWKADFIGGFSDEYIESAVRHCATAPSPRSLHLWFPLSGLATRVARDATAYPHRGGVHAGVYSVWSDPAEDPQNVAWARDGWELMQPSSQGGVYVNELGLDESGERIRAAYGSNHAKLARLKAKYDPQNLFRLNANIQPAG
jgi:FAD/FMN-containing dehydrogenase